MPQLPAPVAAEAAEKATSGFTALEPGVYTAKLAKVEATTTKTAPARPMWMLEFDKTTALADGKTKGGRLFTNLVIDDTSMWKVGQFFGAYGVPTSTNTDALIGHRVRLNVTKRVIGAGARAGQDGNDITGFVPLTEADEGYAEVAKLASKFGGGAAAPAAAKPAAAKAATPATTEAAPAAPAEAIPEAPADPNSAVDF